MNCRHCNTPLNLRFLDLGTAPPSNAYLAAEDLNKAELYLPLRVQSCTTCWLVQTEDYAASDLYFTPDYAYFSSTSKSWLAHAKTYCDMISERLSLSSDSFVVELASNDGYLLKNFVADDIPCLGIEPTSSTAKAATKIGVPTLERFFGTELAGELVEQRKKADLIIGNNVYAHVPDINNFTHGMKTLLAPDGVITLEFPHLLNLIKLKQFDTVYHEHFSYLSLGAVSRIFKAAGLRVFDVEKLPTHGGSLRVYGCHEQDRRPDRPAVETLLKEENNFGLEDAAIYQSFQSKAEHIKNELLKFLIKAKADGKSIAAYGAAAKGNTLLNFAGVRPDLLPFVCDAAAAKQNHFMPGSRIPIYPPAYMTENPPDYILILPWNIADEIAAQLQPLRDQGSQFVVAVPEIKFL